MLVKKIIQCCDDFRPYHFGKFNAPAMTSSGVNVDYGFSCSRGVEQQVGY
jgi:hypothetical protein